MTETPTYDDGKTRLDDAGLTLRHYYAPAASAKQIPYSAIVGVERRTMGWFARLRLWGSVGFTIWMPLDRSRFGKTEMVICDVGTRIRPACSPDDVDAVMAILTERTRPSA